MPTLNGGAPLTDDIQIDKASSKLTLYTDSKYVDGDIEFNISVKPGSAVAGTASADVDVVSGGTNNISASIGAKSENQPSSGYYIKLEAEGSGSSAVTSAGWLGTGELTPSATTAVKYFPITTGTITPSSGSVNSTGLVTIPYTKTAGYIAAGQGSSTYQLPVLAAQTYPVSSSNQSITPGQYLTGDQTILGVTTSGISSDNIRKGATVSVGDSVNGERITSVNGMFTDSSTVSPNQHAAASGQILSGYSAWVDGSEVKGNIATRSSSDITVDENVVTVSGGYYATTNTATVATGEITSGSATISSISYEYNSSSGKFDVGGSASIAQPIINKAGYISSTKGDRHGNTANVLTTVDKITGSVSISGTKMYTPSIEKQSVPAGVTNAASGDATTIPPSSGVYVAVKSTENSGNVTAGVTISKNGYGTSANHGITDLDNVKVGANASSMTYIPISTTSVSINGDVVSYGSGWVNSGSQTVQAGTVVANVSANNPGSATIAATGFTPLASGTSGYYVTLTTSPGSVKASAAGDTSGYITSETTDETSAVNVAVTANKSKIYIPAGSTTVATPTVDSSGLITANATVAAGYQDASTPSKTYQLSTQAANTITPTESSQTAVAAYKYTTGAVTVAAVPSTYVGSGIPRNDSDDLSVSGRNVSVPAGYYAEDASASVGTGSVSLNTPSVNASGLITSSATFSAGYISTAPTNKTYQLSTQSANTITPTESVQTAVAKNKYTTGAVTVAAIPSDYVGSNVPQNDSDDLVVEGPTVTAPSGYYAEDASTTIPAGSVTMGTISVSSGGLITAPATVTAGYVAASTPSATHQLTVKAADTITPGTSNKTIAAGTYLTGTQTIAGDADLTAANIKKGINIFGVAGTYTTVSGKTPLTAAALRTGYAGFADGGSQINGAMPDTQITETATTVSNTTATRGTWSQSAGYTAARTLGVATFSNAATSGSSYVDISATNSAPILKSNDFLYINKGYTDNLKISLARLVPDASMVGADITSDSIVNGYTAYNNEGKIVTGSMNTLVATDVTVSGKTITIPVGKYTGAPDATAITKSVADGDYTPSVTSGGTSTPAAFTPKTTGTITSITTSEQPSGTDGTDYWTITPDGDKTTGKARAKAKATIDPAGYIDAGSKTTSSYSTWSVTTNVNAGTNLYIPAGSVTASVVNNTSGGASMSPNGFTKSNTATSYYVSLATSAGSVKAKADGNAAGYITSSTTYTTPQATSVAVTGNGDKLYIPAGSVTTYVTADGMDTYFNDGTSSDKNVTITPKYTNTAGYKPAVTTATNNGNIKYYKIIPGSVSISGKTVTSTTGWITGSTQQVADGTITNNQSLPSGKTAAGTITRGKYLKIGEGYYTEQYWLAQNVSNGTITNPATKPSGTASSGTISRNTYIKIGAGYYGSDYYYLAQANTGTKNITAAGDTTVDGFVTAHVDASTYYATATQTTAGTITPSVGLDATATSTYGFTTTKPSTGTTGTNYLTVDPNGTVKTKWKVTPKAFVSVAGYAAENTTGTAGTALEGSPSIEAGTNYYVPVVSASFSGGGITVTTNYTKSNLAVTMADGSDKNVTNYTVGAKDTTNYPYYVKVNGSTPAVSGKTKATRAQATYSNGAGVIAAHSSTQIWDSDYAEPTVSVNAASGSTYVGFKGAVIAGSSTNATATTTVAPGTVSVSKQSTPSGVTNAASGNATTTAPSSGVYVAVKATAAANSTGTTSSISGSGTATVSAAGYAPTSLTGTVSVSGTATAKTSAKDSAMTYVPITTANPAFTGGGLSGTATASSSTASISDTTNNSGVSLATACTVTRANVTYNGAVAGWVSKTSGTVALSSGSTAMTAKTYYINGVTLATPASGNARTFTVTAPSGGTNHIYTFSQGTDGRTTIQVDSTLTMVWNATDEALDFIYS